MTKETRIGLLVGLLFIVMFGLVLSELAGTSTIPPTPAAAEENLDNYVHTPVIDDHPASNVRGRPARPAGPVAAAPASPVAPAPGAVIESTLRPPGEAVGRGGIIETEIHPRTIVLAARREQPDVKPPEPAVAPAPVPAPPAPTRPRPRVYTVEAGDNLTRIARKVYGREGEKHYKRIFRANRRTLPNESTLSIGQKLVIPALSEAPARGPTPAAAPATPRPDVTRLHPPAPAGEPTAARYLELAVDELGRRLGGRTPSRSRSRRTYVVQRGDSLTDIARRLLHDDSPAAVRKIFNANRDQLASPDQLSIGMELQIPS